MESRERMEKLRMAADNGTPIEIDGHAWWLKSDMYFMYQMEKKCKYNLQWKCIKRLLKTLG